jgi:outer membrane lipoprotein SlyB
MKERLNMKTVAVIFVFSLLVSIAGGTIGGGSGKGVARAAGAVGGAAAGAAVEEKSTRQTGLEITVKLDNGQVIAVVQAADEQFDEGDRVRVLRRPDGSARVLQ